MYHSLSLSLFALLPLLASTTATPVLKRNEIRGHYISAGRDGQCITPDVPVGSASSVTNGTPVVSRACADSLQWDVASLGTSGSIFVHGNPSFALDAGSSPGNNGALKVWQSYPGLYQQTWFLTGDLRIAITGGNQCLDEGDNGIQTYQCTTGNTNQVFNLLSDGGSTTTTTTSPAPVSTTSSAPISTSTTTAQELHSNGNCVAVERSFSDGTPVNMVPCDGSASQLWDFPANTAGGAVPGNVRLHANTNMCLDAGENPGNGSGLKLWTCYEGLTQQTWILEDLNLQLADLTPPQCLDVVAGSGPDKLGGVQALQTWQCSNNNDPQQVFTTY